MPPKASARPARWAKWPIVMPATDDDVPTKVGVGDSAAFAPSVAAPTGAQNDVVGAGAICAEEHREFAPVFSAPPGLKM